MTLMPPAAGSVVVLGRDPIVDPVSGGAERAAPADDLSERLAIRDLRELMGLSGPHDAGA